MQEQDELQKLLVTERNESDLTQGDDLPSVGFRRNQRKSAVLSVRLGPDDLATIEQIAGRMDVPVSAVVRGWVLRGMAEHGDGSLSSVVGRLQADIERVRELIG